MYDISVELGWKAKDLIGGFIGGAVYSIVMKNSKWYEVVASVFVGTVTAGYLSDVAADKLGLAGGAPAFLIGLTAMALCQGLIAGARKYGGNAGAKGGDDKKDGEGG